MKINNDLLPNLIKTTKTTSPGYTYDCTYVNTQFDNIYNKTTFSTHSGGIDLNNYTADGFYHFDTIPNCANAPTNGWYPSMNYFLIVINNQKTGASGSSLIQLWFCGSPSSDQYKGMWYRARCWGGWYGWLKL